MKQEGHIKFGMSDRVITHMIAMSEYEKLKKQNDILMKALKSISSDFGTDYADGNTIIAKEALDKVKELETKQGE